MPKVSVIVPTYNRAKYLKKCLDSILGQTLRDIELILVDDGSTDETEEVVDNYYDERLKYFKRENHGIGNSRNFGIKNANGAYLFFVDSDDYIESDCLEKLYKKVVSEDLDVVVSGFYNFYKDGKTDPFYIPKFKNTKLSENPNILLDINLGPCNKLFKKELIKENNIKFPEDIKYEDMPFVVNCLKNAEKIGCLSEYLCYFLMDNVSETTVRDERIFDIFKSLDLVIDILNDECYKDILKELVVSKIANYTIQQRYQKNKKIRDRFIDKAFCYMKKVDQNYRKNIYFKKRKFLKSFVEKNKVITKIYCDLYSKMNG